MRFTLLSTTRSEPRTSEAAPSQPRTAPRRLSRLDAVPPPPAIWLIDQEACAEYEAFVAHHPAGSLYHTLAWSRACERAGFGQALPLAAMREERIVAALPLLERSDDARSPRTLSSLPATPAAGVLNADDDSVEHLLHARVLRLAASRGIDRINWHLFDEPRAVHLNGAAPGWICAPLRPLIEFTSVEGGNPPRAAAVRIDRAIDARQHRDTTWRAAANVAAMLDPQAIVPKCTRVARVAGGAAFAWWVQFGFHVHVLAYEPATLTIAECVQIVGALARQADSAAAEWIDFPLPPTNNGWIGKILALERVRVSAEKRELLAAHV